MVSTSQDYKISNYEKLYLKLFNNSQQSIILITQEGLVLNCNKTTEKFFDIEKHQIISKTFTDLIYIPSKLHIFSENGIEPIIKTTLNVPTEFSYQKKKGNLIWLSMSASQIKIEEKLLYLLIFTDITNQKTYDLSKKFTDKKLQEIINLLNSGLMIFTIIDHGRDIIFKNFYSSNNELNTIDKDMLLGNSILELFPKKVKYEIFNKLKRVWKTGKPERFDIGLNEKNSINKSQEIYIFKLSRDEIISIYNDPLEKFDLVKKLRKKKDFLKNIIRNIDKEEIKKSNFEKIVNSILSRFIGKTNYEDAIKSSLKELGSATKASRVFIFIFDEERKFMRNNFEWCNNGIASHKNQFINLPINNFPWAMNQIFEGNYVAIDDISKLPYEARSLKGLLEKNEINSSLFLPIFIEGQIGGFIGFDDENNKRNWDNEDINLLQISSQIIGNAFERKKFEEKIKSSEKKYRELFDKSPHIIVITDSKGNILQINKTTRRYVNIEEKKLIGKNFKDLNFIKPKNQIILNEKLKGLTKKGYFEPIEFNINNKYFNSKWIKLGASLIEFDQMTLIQVIIQDISKEKEGERKLIETEQQQREILESMDAAIHVINKEMQLKFINPTFLKWLSELNIPDIVLNRKLNQVFPFLPNKVFEEYNKVFQTGKTLNSIESTRIGDKSLFTETQKIPIFSKGKVSQVLTVIRDISSRKRTENALIESEEKYRSIFEDSPLSIVLLSLDGKLLDCNPAQIQIFGRSKEELIENDITELSPPLFPLDHIEKVKKAFETLKNGETPGPFEVQSYKNDGSLIWVMLQANLVRLNNTTLIQVISQDIDKIKSAEIRIKESEERYRNILESIKEGFFETDLDGNFTFCNKSLFEHLGYKKDELLGMNVSLLCPEGKKSNILDEFNKLLRKKKGYNILEFELCKKNGETIYLESSIYLKYENHRNIVGFKGLVRDITERIKSESLRRKFNRELEKEVQLRTSELKIALNQQKLYLDQILKASHFKNEFLATMSHELRTPLNSIIGFTELLLEGLYGPLNEEQKNFLFDIKHSSKDLLEMITQILDISKIESGKVSLNLENINLNELFRQIISTMKPLFASKPISFNLIGLKKQKTIRADRIKFKQIINNLLDNAMKFTEKGNITLKVKEKKDFWEFSVSDTGIGIEKEDYDIIFSDFQRVESDYVISKRGTGLGLALTKRIVELHGGKIWFNSKIGKGSTFIFTVPKNFKSKNFGMSTEYFMKLL